MSIAIPVWPNVRLICGAHLLTLKEPKLAIHSNITPGKLGPESAHILMLDYDEWTRDEVYDQLRQSGIFNYFLLPSEHGFHVVDTTKYSWDDMRKLQITARDHDLHSRKTAQYGRAALALHPYGGERVGCFDSRRESLDHTAFYSVWMALPSMDVAKSALSRGRIAFRFYRKYTKVKKVF